MAIVLEFIGGANAHLNRDLQHIFRGRPHAPAACTCATGKAIFSKIFLLIKGHEIIIPKHKNKSLLKIWIFNTSFIGKEN